MRRTRFGFLPLMFTADYDGRQLRVRAFLLRGHSPERVANYGGGGVVPESWLHVGHAVAANGFTAAGPKAAVVDQISRNLS